MNILAFTCLLLVLCNNKGPGGLNELGSWITKQLIQAYHQYDMGFAPGFINYKKGCTRLASLPVACPWSVVLSG